MINLVGIGLVKQELQPLGKEQTTIVDGKGGMPIQLQARIEELQEQIQKSKTPYRNRRATYKNRLSKFVGGVAIIHVGGSTETEMLERKDRVDDALHATKAAIEEGIVPGGGTALLVCIVNLLLEVTIQQEQQIVYEACGNPFESNFS